MTFNFSCKLFMDSSYILVESFGDLWRLNYETQHDCKTITCGTRNSITIFFAMVFFVGADAFGFEDLLRLGCKFAVTLYGKNLGFLDCLGILAFHEDNIYLILIPLFCPSQMSASLQTVPNRMLVWEIYIR